MGKIEERQSMTEDYKDLKRSHWYNRGQFNPKGHHVGKEGWSWIIMFVGWISRLHISVIK